MGPGKALVKGNSQIGALGRGDETILDAQGMADQRQMELAARADAFGHQQVGGRGGQMDIRGPCDGACVKMRGKLRAIHPGYGGNLARLPQTACAARCGLRMLAAPARSTAANSALVLSRLPVAAGMRTARATSTMAGMSSGGTGSSNRRG